MFARTERLTLRPGWVEDAPELVRAIAHETVVTKLAQAPWPYTLGDALDFLALPQPWDEPALLIFAHQPDAVRLVGCVGLHRDGDGVHELGYWLTPGAWGRGYATEAARALLANARHTMRVKRVVSGHYVDNPASGRVLRKLGFRATGQVVPQFSRARGEDVATARFELDLDAGDACLGRGNMCHAPTHDMMAA